MSRSQPTLTNPATRFFQWKGATGELVYYDKDKQKNIPVRLPFEFMVLDELATVKGYCEPDESGYYSNEVRNLSKDEFIVKTKKGTKKVGLYKDLADVRSKGAKYTQSIYIAHKDNGIYVIGNIQASGAALTSWIDYKKHFIPQNGATVLQGSRDEKKGTNTYKIPIFEYHNIEQDDNEIALELDKQLQIYLSQYLSANSQDQDERPDSDIDQSIGLATPEQIADYDAKVKAMKAKKSEITDTAAEFADDMASEFSESDIPDFA